MKLSRGIQTCSTDRAYPSADPPSFCTITNIQIHKYTNTQIYKYTNTQVHKYTNTNIQTCSAHQQNEHSHLLFRWPTNLFSHLFGLSKFTSALQFLTQHKYLLIFCLLASSFLCASLKYDLLGSRAIFKGSILSICRPLSSARDLFRYEEGANRSDHYPAGNGLG